MEPSHAGNLDTWLAANQASSGVLRGQTILGSGQGTTALTGSHYKRFLWQWLGQKTVFAMSRSRPVGQATLTAGPPWGSSCHPHPHRAASLEEMNCILLPATPRSQHPRANTAPAEPAGAHITTCPARQNPSSPQPHHSEQGDSGATLHHAPASARGSASLPHSQVLRLGLSSRYFR